MKKTLALVLTLILAVALMVSFAACNKDTFESVDVTADEAAEIIAEFTEKTANATNFSISITDADGTAQYTIMAQENKSALLGTDKDGQKIFVGKMWNEIYEDYDDADYYIYSDEDGWESGAVEFVSESAAIENLGCNEAVTALENILKTEEFTVSMKKNLKNGNLVNYEGTISDDDVTVTFKTTEFDGVQLISELTVNEEGETVSYKYEFGKTFEVPTKY